jgi:hypothetical protein
MIKLTPEQQKIFSKRAPKVLSPCGGVWGLRGATTALLSSARVGLIRAALEEAVRNTTAQTQKKG